jgi:hypothetical protein
MIIKGDEKNVRFWEIGDYDELYSTTIEEALERFFGEDPTPIPDAYTFPNVTVTGWAPVAITDLPRDIAQRELDNVLESLWDEYGNPDGEPEDLLSANDTEYFRTKLVEFYAELISRVKVWSCEEVASAHLTGDEVKQILRREHPEWFENR